MIRFDAVLQRADDFTRPLDLIEAHVTANQLRLASQKLAKQLKEARVKHTKSGLPHAHSPLPALLHKLPVSIIMY